MQYIFLEKGIYGVQLSLQGAKPEKLSRFFVFKVTLLLGYV